MTRAMLHHYTYLGRDDTQGQGDGVDEDRNTEPKGGALTREIVGAVTSRFLMGEGLNSRRSENSAVVARRCLW